MNGEYIGCRGNAISTVGEAYIEAFRVRKAEGLPWGPGVFYEITGLDPDTPIVALLAAAVAT